MTPALPFGPWTSSTSLLRRTLRSLSHSSQSEIAIAIVLERVVAAIVVFLRDSGGVGKQDQVMMVR